jgi:hypothetical protein
VLVCASLGGKDFGEAGCLAILLPVLAGYAFVCFAHLPLSWFYRSICDDSGLPDEQDVKPKIPHLVIGTFERVLAFFLVWLMSAERVQSAFSMR